MNEKIERVLVHLDRAIGRGVDHSRLDGYDFGEARRLLCQLVQEARVAALEEAAIYVASAPLGCSVDADELADDIRKLIDDPDHDG